MNTYNQVKPILLRRRDKEKSSSDSSPVPVKNMTSGVAEASNGSQSGGTSIPEIKARLLRERRAQITPNNSSSHLQQHKVDYTPDFDMMLSPIADLIKGSLPDSFIRFVEKQFQAAKRSKFNAKQLKVLRREIRTLVKFAVTKNVLLKNDWDQQPLTMIFQGLHGRVPPFSEHILYCFSSPEQGRKVVGSIPYEQLGIDPPSSYAPVNTTNQLQLNDPNSIMTIETQASIPPPPPPEASRPTPPWAQQTKHVSLARNTPPGPPPGPPPCSPPTSTVANTQATRKDEKNKRLERLKRFASPEVSSLTTTSKRVKIDDDDSYSDLNAITNKAYKFDKDKPIVGQCQVLEKKYLRLTSEPDPAKVRPLHVLKKALDWILEAFRSGACSYPYFCDQMKSIRQDLKVQMIENDFTVTVYKTHARIALENGDIGEYNQCQSSLRPLFEKDNIDKSDLPEFISYRILYHMMTSDHSSINQLRYQLLTSLREIYHDNMVQRALALSDAQITNDYHLLMQIYQQTKGPERHLINQFIKKERLNALNCMCKAYAKLPLQFLAPELHFTGANEAFEFLTELQLLQFMVIPENNPDDIFLDCKKCLPTIIKHFSDSRRVDIKGQI